MIARIRVVEPDSKAEQPKPSARSRPQPDQMIRLALGQSLSPSARKAYRFKPTSFALSVFLHAGIVAALLTIGSSGSVHPSSRPIYDTEIRPHESKIVWYQFKRGLPSINPAVPIRQSERPTATTRSPNTIIAIPEDRRALEQFIAHESQDKLIERDVRAPNLVAVTAPPPPRETPKAAPPPRPFVTPPSQSRPKIDAPTQILDAPKLELPVAPIMQPALPDPSLMKRILPTPPPPPPPPVVVVDGTPGSQGSSVVTSNSNVEAVVVGLNPADRLSESVPDGRRSANISTAPNSGRESADITPSGATAAGLTTRGKAGANVDPGAAASTGRSPEIKEGILYRDAIAGPMPSTLSAPLRPSSRRIPAALEMRFRNRTVYALSIPAPKLPEYGGNWTLWFAETDPSADDMSQVRAPLPYRKAGAPKPAISSTTELRVQVALVIDEEGKVDSLTLQGTPIERTEVIVADIRAWQFKPATKNGKPVRVEVVLEIPYRLPAQIAQN